MCHAAMETIVFVNKHIQKYDKCLPYNWKKPLLPVHSIEICELANCTTFGNFMSDNLESMCVLTFKINQL